jgi:hypothetical protein
MDEGRQQVGCPEFSGTEGATNQDEESDCIVQGGYYNDNGDLVLCPAGSFCPGGPLVGTSGPGLEACPGGQISDPGSSSASDCLGCVTGLTDCNGVCTNLIDNANCGACGTGCIPGATCTPLGSNQTPTCICDNSQLPYFTPSTGTCGALAGSSASQTQVFTVTPNQPLTLTYDAIGVPDR